MYCDHYVYYGTGVFSMFTPRWSFCVTKVWFVTVMISPVDGAENTVKTSHANTMWRPLSKKNTTTPLVLTTGTPEHAVGL